MSGNKFVAWEFVERISDGAVGQVRAIYRHADDTWTYGVKLEHVPGQNDYVTVGEGALRRYHRIHAHVNSDSRDCDGTYLKSHTEVLTTEERCSRYGDLYFKDRVVTSIISLHGHGTLKVESEGCVWDEPTEEGHRLIVVTWCDDEDCDRTGSQRDLTAESMGY